MNLKFTLALALLVLIGCHEDKVAEPAVIKDNALLESIDVSNAIALISATRKDIPYAEPGSDHMFYYVQELYRVNPDKTTALASFNIVGGAGRGFEYYQVNDVSNDYFLISFYKREQTYFVSKSTGKAFLTTFLQPGEFYEGNKISKDTFYHLSLAGLHVVSNFLDAGKMKDSVLATKDFYATDLFVDKNANPYCINKYDLYTWKDGAIVNVTTDYISTWTDVKGDLRTIDLLGNVSIISNGVLSPAGKLKNKPDYSPNALVAYNFPAYQKTLGFLTDIFYEYYLYDLQTNLPLFKFKREDLPNNVQFAGGNVTDKYLELIFTSYDQTSVLIRVDITNNTFTQQEFPFNGTYTTITCLNNDVDVIMTCSLYADCDAPIQFLTKDGVSMAFSKQWSGYVVKLKY